MAGDYTKFQRHYGNLTTDAEVTALTPDPLFLMAPRNAAYQIFLQKVTLMVVQYPTSITTVTLQGVTSGRVFAKFTIPVAAQDNQTDFFDIDYGPTGLGTVIGDSIAVYFPAGNIDFQLHIEAYQRLVLTTSANSGQYTTVVGTPQND